MNALTARVVFHLFSIESASVIFLLLMKDKLVCIRNSCVSDSTVIRKHLTSVLLLNAI